MTRQDYPSPTTTIASAYLQDKDREKHKIWFSTEHLQILYKGRHRVFEMGQIRRLAFNHRKLMLPLLLGSIAASLSLVAIIKLYYDPWLMLSILTFGCLTAYWGYMGSWVLTVEEERTYTDFFLKTISPGLKAFVAYANTFTGQKEKGILYLPLQEEEWQAARESGYLDTDQDTRLFFIHELGDIPLRNPVILPVPSLQEGIRLGWKKQEEVEESLHPYLLKNSYLPLQGIHPLNMDYTH